MYRPAAGFTLIELMIVVVIIGILGAFVYPLYGDYVRRAYRSQIIVLMMEQAQSLERFYTRNAVYSGVKGLSSGNQHYHISAELADHGYWLEATPRQGSAMAGDPCGSFRLAHTGMAAITQAAPGLTLQQCWGR
ncbi:pilus assembly protein [Pseudomonas fragi]|uniref:type IV pilin protein n=1 Tax=Pseudomonas fragi TaxID=296 RepID=UPI000BA2A99F|nr:type IV pilin protein [Pseudomonas fragi]PAA22715.1 pilus assembly protein [Pseudomonas fragi]